MQDVEVDEVDDERRLQQIPHHEERSLGGASIAGAEIGCYRHGA